MQILRQINKKFQRSIVKHFKISTMERLDIPDDSWSKKAKESNALLENFAQLNNWEKHDLVKQTGDIRTYGRCGNEKIFYGALFYSIHEQRAKGSITYGPWSSNGTNYVHGGAIATHHDSIAGTLVTKLFGPCVTAYLNINYKSPMSVGSTFLYECDVKKVEGRKIFVENKIFSFEHEQVVGDASALFVMLKKDLL
ncbi:acyl-coenzyme A thioesterase THEM4 isoform X1 [Hydra vulgaris]|uniref:acyl-coenzyme A thioesterase THEM4 isoform X1 n=1 Tax=Hydra vulgaris TaxID=6087 RepID=UPI001F5EE8F9|nr:acyl-coenzyme A thioesterase THEM4 [Hydra vulgaris]